MYNLDVKQPHKTLPSTSKISIPRGNWTNPHRAVLKNAEKVEKRVADALAVEQYEEYKLEQRRIEATEPTSDFDKFIDDIGKLNPPDETENS